MIRIIIGNIFDSKQDVLVNTVNCAGVMGKGIAKDFKKKYPKMFKEYKELCDEGQIKPGILYPYYINKQVKVLNFPTKTHWKAASKLEYVEEGLDYFVSHYDSLGISSIAFPPLGCGNGGLDFEVVGSIMCKKLNDLPIDIEIYAPFDTPSEKLDVNYYLNLDTSNTKVVNREIIHKKDIDPSWYLILYAIQKINALTYSMKVTRNNFSALCILAYRAGLYIDLLNIDEMITTLANNNYLIVKQVNESTYQIEVKDRYKVDFSKYSQKDIDAINKTINLFTGLDLSNLKIVLDICDVVDQLWYEHNTSITDDLIWNCLSKKGQYDELTTRELIQDLVYLKFVGMG